MRLVILLRSLWLLAFLAGAAAQTPLTDIASVNRLPFSETSNARPVQLKATVTFHDPETRSLFINDGTGNIFVRPPGPHLPAHPLKPGDQLLLKATVSPGNFKPLLDLQALEETGSGPLPPPQPVTGAGLFDPALDCAWVELHAIVKSTTIDRFGALFFDLEADGYPIQVHVSRSEKFTTPPWHLLERRVRVRCVVATLFNDDRQMCGRRLFLPRLEEMIVEPDATPPAETPVRLTKELLRADSPPGERVRLQGLVTMVEPGTGLTLRDSAGSLLIRTAQQQDLQVGDRVEVHGFPAVDRYRPQLRAVEVQRLSRGEPLEPVAFDSKPPYPSRFHQELVTLEALLIDLTPLPEGVTLLCAADSGERFEAHLQGQANVTFAPGSRLRLTGICNLIPRVPNSAYNQATRWEMQLRQAGDVRLVKAPPWLTPRRAAWLLGGLLTTAGIAALWVFILRRQVRAQSRVIRHQAAREATVEERQRIARELHDTLEQDLMGVTMLLDGTAQQMEKSGLTACGHLTLARQLLRRSREESHSTIRDLRSVALDQLGLPGAMEELLQPMAAAARLAFQLQVSGPHRRLPAVVEHHLLRIAHEGVSNAVKHARASRIDLHLTYQPEAVHLQIQDDGQGGATVQTVGINAGFGLHSLRERANKLGAALQLESPPGQGTCIRLTVPLTAASPSFSP